MGQVWGAPADEEQEFPWFQILQWSTEDLKSSEIFQYDLTQVRNSLEEIWKNEDAFREACDGAGDDAIQLACDEDSEEQVWLSWAAALLEKSPKLSALRYALVPRKMSETVFWQKVFGCARKAVLSTI